jgi:copper chaperone
MSLKQTILAVDGMSCGSCVRHVEQALRELDSVTSVQVDLQTGKVVVDHGDGAPVKSMIAALSVAGYDARPVV